MLLLTSLSLVIQIPKLAQDNGKSQEVIRGNQWNGIRNLSNVHVFHIFHCSHDHYSIFNLSCSQFSKNRWVAVKEISRKSHFPLEGSQNSTHIRVEDYIKVESALEWREEHFISTSQLEGEGLCLRMCGGAEFWSMAEIENTSCQPHSFLKGWNYIWGSTVPFFRSRNKAFWNTFD